MVGGAGVGGNEKKDVKSNETHWTNHQEMIKIAKRELCKLFCLLFVRRSPKSGGRFFLTKLFQ
jgi:hypothetical protein